MLSKSGMVRRDALKFGLSATIAAPLVGFSDETERMLYPMASALRRASVLPTPTVRSLYWSI